MLNVFVSFLNVVNYSNMQLDSCFETHIAILRMRQNSDMSRQGRAIVCGFGE